MKSTASIILLAALVCVVAISCDKALNPLQSTATAGDDFDAVAARYWPDAAYPPPSGLVTVEFGGNTLEFWPFTGEDFSGTPQDPINLVFVGNADPRDIRAALLSLDGDRTAFGYYDIPPFNSTWDDAIGDVQPGFGNPGGWTPGVVQLACGEYGPIRYHLRLFKIGDWTVGNVHFELQVPGTADHEVLSWKVAKELVMVDMMRSGLLDEQVPMGFTQYINQEPFREIPAMVYNEVPVEIRAYIEGPLDDVTEDVPIPTDGIIPIFNLTGSAPRVAEVRTQDFVIQYGQYVPKPFCASSPYDWVYVEGPVNLIQTTTLTESGEYTSFFRAEGELSVTPIDMSTGQPAGETLTAVVKEHHDAHLSDYYASASAMLLQNIVPASDPNSGSLFKRIRVSSNGPEGFQLLVKCAGDEDFVDVTDDAACQLDLTNATTIDQ